MKSGRQTAVTDGVLVVAKEAGWTSHDVVAKIRRIFGGVKVGHAGTLDPAATGVLPVLVGRATRVAEYLVEWDKEYRAVLRLGVSTDTQDATGKILTQVDSVRIDEGVLRGAVHRFLGPQLQVPPMYSAVKVGGKPLYREARAGRTVERRERSVTIHVLEILAVAGRDVTLRVVCSKGTYIRTLCADIGQVLGVGGHLYALERQRVGPLSIDEALTIDQIAALSAVGTLRERVIPIDRVLEHLPALTVSREQSRRILHGGSVSPEGMGQLRTFSAPISIRLKDEANRLLAIGRCGGDAAGSVKIEKVLADIRSYE